MDRLCLETGNKEDGQAELGRRLVQVGNFFQIISRVILHFIHFFLVDLPYVSVTLIVLNIFFVMTSPIRSLKM